MFIVSSKIEFDASHWLVESNTPCDMIHGHRWSIEAQISSTELNKFGMVINFTLLKKWLKEIVETYDHNIINRFVSQPTAENLSKFIFNQLVIKLRSQRALYEVPLKVHLINIYETPNNNTIYTQEYDLEKWKNDFVDQIKNMRKTEWENDEKRASRIEKIKEAVNTEKEKRKRSERMIKNNPMRNRLFVEKMMKSLKKTLKKFPNNEEKKLLSILNKINSGFEYVGDGSFILSGKNPDFVHYKKKKLIEYNNSFWHSGDNKWYVTKDDSKERILFFKELGYECLIVDEKELKNEKELIKKLKDYSR